MTARFFGPLLALFAVAVTGCDESVSEGDRGNGWPPRESPTAALMAATAETASTPLDQQVSASRDSCPVTLPPSQPFVPPAPVKPNSPTFARTFWYGSAELWTHLRLDGSWDQLRLGGDKSFWWSEGYDWRTDPTPALQVTAERLDGPAPRVVNSGATHAINVDDIGAAMLTGLEVPTGGCWRIEGTYRGATLAFVVWVAP